MYVYMHVPAVAYVLVHVSTYVCMQGRRYIEIMTDWAFGYESRPWACLTPFGLWGPVLSQAGGCGFGAYCFRLQD